jgi:hypothetical protein
MSISERLGALGVELHEVPASIANYVLAVRSGNLVTTAGQVSVHGDMVGLKPQMRPNMQVRSWTSGYDGRSAGSMSPAIS